MPPFQRYATPYVIMGIGAPGSGKTTILKRLAKKLDAMYLCTDDIREELAGDAADQSVNTAAWQLLHQRAERALKSGSSVVVDATHAARWQRRRDAAFYRRSGAKSVLAFWVDTDLPTILKQNAKRSRVVPELAIRRMYDSLRRHPAENSEGFDDIIRIRNDP